MLQSSASARVGALLDELADDGPPVPLAPSANAEQNMTDLVSSSECAAAACSAMVATIMQQAEAHGTRASGVAAAAKQMRAAAEALRAAARAAAAGQPAPASNGARPYIPPATMSGASRAMIAAQPPPEADGQPTELSRLDRIGSLLFELTDDAEPPAQPDSLPMALKGYDERGGAQRPAAREAHKEGHRRNSNKGSHREHKEAKDNRQESDAYKNRLNKLMSISQPQGLGDQGKGKSSSRSRSSLPLPDETEDV